MEAIVEAAARVLAQEGYEAATTRRVAERAGVSVGSLYQYFPSRDALVSAVLERHIDELIQAVGVLVRRLERTPFDDAIRRVVAKVLEIHARNPELHAVLSKELPRADRGALLARLNRALAAHLETLLARRPEIPPFDVARAASVLGSACIPLVHADRRGFPGGAGRQAEDLYLVVVSFLRALMGEALSAERSHPNANDSVIR